MAALSDFAEKLILDWLMTTGSAPRPTAWFLALYTAAPSDSGGGTEVSGGGYARQALAFDAASSPEGETSNSALVDFTASDDWGSITHIAIFTAVTAGDMLWHGALTDARIINTGDKLEFAPGAIQLKLD